MIGTPSSPTTASPADSRTAEEIVASVEGLLIERCVLPCHEYDITGTCSENPVARDETERTVIRKGTNEPTFIVIFVLLFTRLRTPFPL